ncbi:hypothetical protein IEQ_00185 [Bacillus cereus BAG6X1-2]|nr:hypothetical protein IEQ_00185 [Bacillus cereus BAG6X1-2]
MKHGKLKEQLDEALENFKESTRFQLETFEQTHENEHLTKEDMEEMNRYTFYCLNDFKNSIIKYLEENDR